MSFPVDEAACEPQLEEENFMDADDAVQDDWSSNELPESVREYLYQWTPKETEEGDSEGALSLGASIAQYFCADIALGRCDSGCAGVRQGVDLPRVYGMCRAVGASGGLGADQTSWAQQGCACRFGVP